MELIVFFLIEVGFWKVDSIYFIEVFFLLNVFVIYKTKFWWYL